MQNMKINDNGVNVFVFHKLINLYRHKNKKNARENVANSFLQPIITTLNFFNKSCGLLPKQTSFIQNATVFVFFTVNTHFRYQLLIDQKDVLGNTGMWFVKFDTIVIKLGT